MMAHPVVRGDEHGGVPQSSRNDFFMFSHEVRYAYVFKLHLHTSRQRTFGRLVGIV